MAKAARPTYRCLKEDLAGEGWADPDQRRAAIAGTIPGEIDLHELRHELIQSAAGRFPGGDNDTQVEWQSISGLTSPMWWKEKTGRWRGAVYVDEHDQAWLCAGGIRRAGDPDDFYKDFTKKISSKGADAFLPTAEDRARLQLELAREKITAWERRIATLTIAAVATAADGVTAHFEIPHPLGDIDDDGNERDPIARLELAIDRTDPGSPTPEDALAEVVVEFVVHDWSEQPRFRVARNAVCRVIAPQEDAWDRLPSDDNARHVGITTEGRLAQILAAASLGDDGTYSLGDASTIAPVSHAHFTGATSIAEAVVEGKAVMGLCGRWFVPRRDPTDMPVCPECESRHRDLQDIKASSKVQ